MGNVVVTEFVTLDGVIEDPGGSEKTPAGGWAFRFERGDAGNRFKFDELMAADAMLLGRVTYEGFAANWPAMDGDDFGRKMNGMPKHVVSSTLESADWENSSVLRGDLAQEVARLKEQYEGDILVAGSSQLAQSLLALDLVDQLNLMIYPLLLGTGKRLFPDGNAPQSFEVVETGQAGETVTMILRRKAA